MPEPTVPQWRVTLAFGESLHVRAFTEEGVRRILVEAYAVDLAEVIAIKEISRKK